MANDEMTTLSVAETDNDPQKNAQALERLLQSMFDASNQIVRDAGTRFETLIRDWFMNEPTYKDHFSEVQTWKDWANQHPNLTFNAKDTGIDLVGTLADGSYAAIQCKFYQADAHVPKAGIDSFLEFQSQGVYRALHRRDERKLDGQRSSSACCCQSSRDAHQAFRLGRFDGRLECLWSG